MSITFTSVANPGCLSRILYPNFFHPGSWICIKVFMYFNPKKWFLSSRKYDPGCSDFLRIPDPRVKKAPDSGSATLIFKSACCNGGPSSILASAPLREVFPTELTSDGDGEEPQRTATDLGIE
jgi:hypothetical protein